MSLSFIDYAIIFGYFLIALAIGLWFTKKAGKSISNFFLGGRNLPWWLVGTSMVATTFAADTPLAVTEIVAKNGIAGNWIWWSALTGGMFTTFFFAKYWRRAEVLTDLELIEMRYSGKIAGFLRGFKSIYIGLFLNAIIIGWVNLALMSLLEVFFDIPKEYLIYFVGGAMLLVVAYSSMSGLLGVAVTDVFQFVIAMAGCVVLAVLVLNSEEVGGVEQLKSGLPESTFSFFPKVGESTGGGGSNAGTYVLSIASFIAFVGIQWWSSWYPGAEPGGGGYIAQRMLSAKNEKHAVGATLLFQIAHYCLRPWPWIIVALCAIPLYNLSSNGNDHIKQELDVLKQGVSIEQTTNLQHFRLNQATEKQKDLLKKGINSKKDLVAVYPWMQKRIAVDNSFDQQISFFYEPKLGFPYVMKNFLPNGLKGLLLVAFFAAYMSTISTQLNWGASYIVNDFYQKYVTSDEKSLVKASRITTFLLMLFGLFITTQINSISGVWEFILECGAGLGIALIMRWFWWRVNAIGELVATITPIVVYGVLFLLKPSLPAEFLDNKGIFFTTVGVTVVAFFITVLTTRPSSTEHVQRFYDKVKPLGMWGPFRKSDETGNTLNFLKLTALWLVSIVLCYAILFGIGSLIFQNWGDVLLYGSITAVSLIAFFPLLKHAKVFD